MAIATARYNRRSAEASEASAVSSDRSADAAKDAAESARAVARSELGRDHREHAPDLSSGTFKSVRNQRTGKDAWFFFYTVPKTYRMFGDMINENGSRSPFELGGAILEAGVEYKVFVSEKHDAAMPEMLEFRFYTPRGEDPGENWSCHCGEPDAPEYEGRGHWVVRVPVKKPPQPATVRVIR